ncbi:MAG: glycosyltransferase family 4 protein [Patescibacteria group bacterium]|nr:glycosyltransferase family 4 protein [Patescibacteria group bacterium]
MRIALISFHSFFQPGGVKTHILGLAKEFRKKGVESKIIVPRRKRKEYYGKNVILLGTSFPFPFAGATSDLTINFNPLAIEDTLRKEKFDVLHFHNFGFPSILQILASPAVSNTLNILTFHANIKGSKFMTRFPFLLNLINKICQWKIDGIIGVAPFILKYFKGYRGPKIVIPNGIDLEIFNPEVQKIKKYADGKINILFLGRIEKRKGLIYLLKAYKILERNLPPNFSERLRLIIVGEGPLKEDLEKWVKFNKLKNVIFEGEVPEEIVPSFYKSCDIYCSPAIFGESFGLVLLEAMACQKPIVAFGNEGYKKILTGKGARFLAEPRDYKTLAQKLEILIKNEKLRKEMGDWGIKEAQKYSWTKIASQVLNFYQLCQQNKQKRKI